MQFWKLKPAICKDIQYTTAFHAERIQFEQFPFFIFNRLIVPKCLWPLFQVDSLYYDMFSAI